MDILINELSEIQKEHGYLPEAEIERIAKEKGIQKAQLYGVISFYSRFYVSPVGKNIIRVCKSVSCGMNGSREIRDAIKQHLNLNDSVTNDSATTEDGLFTFEYVECLGLCNLSPAMTINDEVYEALTPEKAIEVIESYRKR